MAQCVRILLTRRIGNLAGFIACAVLIAAALYLQYVVGIEPCPLCVLQRIAVIATGIAFLAATIHHPGRIGGYIYGALIAILSVAGVVAAGRHVWLQYTPEDKRPACGPVWSISSAPSVRSKPSAGCSAVPANAARWTGRCSA